MPSVPGVLVSSLGRVEVPPFVREHPSGGLRHHRGHIRSGWTNTQATVRVGGLPRDVARMMCEAWHGPAPADRPYCIRLSDDPAQLRPDTVCWGRLIDRPQRPRRKRRSAW